LTDDFELLLFEFLVIDEFMMIMCTFLVTVVQC